MKDDNGEIVSSKKDIADTLGKHFQQCSSSNNYSKEFKKIKRDVEKNDINFNTNEHRNYNKKFKMRDLKWSIKK